MADESPGAGLYELRAVRWRRKNSDGGFVQYWQGDKVQLTADEAARLVTGKTYSAFIPVESDVKTKTASK